MISIEDILLYLIGIGFIIIIFLSIKIICRCNKEIKLSKKIDRKKIKELLKFISNKKNKTW